MSQRQGLFTLPGERTFTVVLALIYDDVEQTESVTTSVNAVDAESAVQLALEGTAEVYPGPDIVPCAVFEGYQESLSLT